MKSPTSKKASSTPSKRQSAGPRTRSFAPRPCDGCGKSTGNIVAVNRGYWHPKCWEAASDDQRERPRRERQRQRSEAAAPSLRNRRPATDEFTQPQDDES